VDKNVHRSAALRRHCRSPDLRREHHRNRHQLLPPGPRPRPTRQHLNQNGLTTSFDAAGRDPDDATKLGELLTFLGDWLESTHSEALAASLRRFVGTEGYDLDELRTDLARFAFLLGTDDGTQLFDLNQH
jgi:hypothetical protein